MRLMSLVFALLTLPGQLVADATYGEPLTDATPVRIGELVAHPEVRVEVDGKSADYVAVVVTGDEFDRIAAEFSLPLFMRFLMGFPPGRDIVRLDAVSSGAQRP